jgi:hypothetical protein
MGKHQISVHQPPVQCNVDMACEKFYYYLTIVVIAFGSIPKGMSSLPPSTLHPEFN